MASIVKAQMGRLEKHIKGLLETVEFVVIRTVNDTEYEFSKKGKKFILKKISSSPGGFVPPGEEFELDSWNLRLGVDERIRMLVHSNSLHETGPIKEIVVPIS